MRIEEIDARLGEIRSLLNDENADLDALEAETNKLMEERTKIVEAGERRAALIGRVSGGAGRVVESHNAESITDEEKRAAEFVKTGHTEMRAILSTGQIAKPKDVSTTVSGLADVGSGIIDDVHAVEMVGAGAWEVPYKKSDAKASDVTEGQAVAGTASTYGVVTINPSEWGVYDEVSRQVEKMTPANYLAAVETSALIALREEGANKIITAVQSSDLVEKRNSIPLDDKYVRDLVMGYRSIAGKGPVKLYINKDDMATLGKVRGTNEKRAVYQITYDDGGLNLSGTIQDGGTAVSFRITDGLATGTQLFGQPMNIDMPMWGGYEIETDNGGDLFKRRMIGVNGTQTANADLVAFHGMQLIKQAAE